MSGERPTRTPRPQAYVVLTGTGPILVLTVLASADSPELRRELARRGVGTYIAWRVPSSEVHRAYGSEVEEVVANLDRERPLRVLDFDGRRVLGRLPLSRLSEPVSCQRCAPTRDAGGTGHRL